jgi:predicted metal-dependent peptidase
VTGTEPYAGGDVFAAARLWAARHFPYFATGLFALVPIPVPGLPGVASDRRWRIYLDPDSVSEKSAPELGAVLVHHLLHLLRDHGGRAESHAVTRTAASRWNLACDLEVNDDLRDAGLSVTGALLPEVFGWQAGELAEQYFARARRVEITSGPTREGGAPDEGDPHPPGVNETVATDGDTASCDDPAARRSAPDPSCGSGCHGLRGAWERDDGEAPTVTEADAQLIRHHVARDVREHAAGPGDLPAGLRRWAEAALSPVVDWRRVFGAEIRRATERCRGRVDYGFSRPSRRSAALEAVVLPSTHRPAPRVVLVVDTSGSMGRAELDAALAEVEAILARAGLPASRVPVLSCDTEVHTVTLARRAEDLELTGGGGTDMGAGIAAATRLRPRPEVVTVFTDGWTPWPDRPPRGVAVIVALVGTAADGTASSVPRWARPVIVGDRRAA